MSRNWAEPNLVCGRAEGLCRGPTGFGGGKITIFHTQSHLIIQPEAYAAEGLVGKHRRRVGAINVRTTDVQIMRIQSRYRAAAAPAEIRGNVMEPGKLELGIDQKRYVGVVGVYVRRARNCIHPVPHESGFRLRGKPGSHLKPAGKSHSDTWIVFYFASRRHRPKEFL